MAVGVRFPPDYLAGLPGGKTMTQPPYGGAAPPPDGPPYQPDPYAQPGYGQPAYPPAVDPYASPVSGQPAPPPAYPQPAPGAYPGSPAAYPQPVSGDPYQPYGQPATPYPASGQPYPASGGFPQQQPAYAAYPPPGPQKKKRGPLIAAIIVVALVLCAGGGVSAWLLLRNVETGDGAAEPVAAVEAFMKAVYTDKDASKAASLVCSEARDEADISRRVSDIKAYDSKYDHPRFDWDDPKVDDKTDKKAVVSVKLTMVTEDEKTSEQQLKFTVVKKTGWWICEIA
jgi:hypothetical protein